MSLLVFVGLLAGIVVGVFALQFLTRLRALNIAPQSRISGVSAAGYRPMLRLLSDDDVAFLSANKALLRKLRQNRSRIFRAYLRCLTKDYGRLLMGIRQTMLRSGVDRPDLARALAKNRMLFAMALCRIQYRLVLHEAGFGKVDISPLVEALEALRSQVNLLAPPKFAAYSATI